VNFHFVNCWRIVDSSYLVDYCCIDIVNLIGSGLVYLIDYSVHECSGSFVATVENLDCVIYNLVEAD